MIDAGQIREHLEVVGSDGSHIGTVDHLEGNDRIKLTEGDRASGGTHHTIPLSWVEKVDDRVHLSKTSSDVMADWRH